VAIAVIVDGRAVPGRTDSMTMPEVDQLLYSKSARNAGWVELMEFAAHKNTRDERIIETYSFGAIFRQYCGLPSWFPLRVYSQHGVSLWAIAPRHELDSREPYLFVHSRRWMDLFHAHGKKTAVAVGSPYVLYRRHLLPGHLRSRETSRGAIFYLSHSSYWGKANWDNERLIALLEEIREREGSLTVCVHFVDVVNGMAKPLFDAGFDIAIAGHFFNRNFARNFYRLLLSHRVVYTNAVGSHVFYAVEAGKDIKWVDLPAQYTNLLHPEDVWNDNQRMSPIEGRIQRLLQLGPAGRDELESIVRDELGIDLIPSRAQLLKYLLYAFYYRDVLYRTKNAYWRLMSRRAPP
jgi:hypothetical protein